MSTVDLSRNATDLRKRYAGVRMQQGRVLTDDDFNEAAVLDAEDMRRTRVDAIGAYGSSDGGCLIKDFALAADLGVPAPGKPTFRIGAGTVYLGGLRIEVPADENFHLQKDWLNFDPAVNWPAAPAAGQTRTDLVWIAAWQQPVSAIEDAELFEAALGGADTSTRQRTMRRVSVMPGVAGADCATAWAAAQASFAALGTLAGDMELATPAKLQVTFTVASNTADLCSPPVPGGYLGAENQAIRVQLVSPTHYTWGYDNAAPLYRVQLQSKNGQQIVVKMQNLPKDAVHWPLQGQVAEILPWSAALANGECVAELSGHFSKVSVSYNPDEQTFELTTAVPGGFGTLWKNRSDKNQFCDGTAADEYLFLRMWNRGDDLASAATIPIASGQLGNTGFSVSFLGAPLRANDYWIIAARPATPDQVVPWLLEAAGGAPIHGVKRYYAPLGLIEWTNLAGVISGKLVHDCRPPFLPLTKIRGCCSVSVGDGTNSYGHFSSINAAIAALPPAGGTVCVLPGVYNESVSFVGRKNIVLHGCGPRSRIVAQEANNQALPAIHIDTSTDIAVESLALEGGPAAVVHIEEGCHFIRVAENLIQMRDDREKPGVWPAVFTRGDDVEIEGNIVEIMPEELPLPDVDRLTEAEAARGGIQIGGGSERVRVRDNRITGGIGHGIALGSILKIDGNNPDGVPVPDLDTVGPCPPCEPNDSTVPENEDPQGPRYVSAGDLYDIEIVDNHILRHGASGIGVVRYFIVTEKSVDIVAVHGLLIRGNRILRNLRREVANIPDVFKLVVGYGGITLALASRLYIEDNDIIGNGVDWRSPVCGIYALRVDGLRIEHNRIEDNGRRGSGPVSEAQPGIRAGIHIWLARPATIQVANNPAFVNNKSVTGDDQLRIHANHVIQPLGRALFMLGEGPMLVTDNRLASLGAGEPATDFLADTVLIVNFGMNREWTQGLIATFFILIFLKLFGDVASGAYAQAACVLSKLSKFTQALAVDGPTGKILFDDNQVSFLMQDQEGPFGFALCSVLLFSADDVSACDNQFECHAPHRLVLSDVVAGAFTVRTSDNRLAETWGRAFLSLLSIGFMNTAADNQSTHCIRALGLLSAVHDNLVLAEAFCDDACESKGGLIGALALGAMAMAMASKP